MTDVQAPSGELPWSKDALLNARLQSFRQVNRDADKAELLMKKIKLCRVINFDWTNTNADRAAKSQKRKMLIDITEQITETNNWFSEELVTEVMKTLSINLFRALPPSEYEDFDPLEDEPKLEPSWMHIHIVYEFLLRFFTSTNSDPDIVLKHLPSDFIISMLELFDSQDHREREYLKTILHRTYVKFTCLRVFIRKAIRAQLFDFIYGRSYKGGNGIGEFLELYTTFIKGFSTPLVEEHKDFLESILLPLHSSNQFKCFARQLSYCTIEYLEKNPRKILSVIRGLMAYWPVQSAAKRMLIFEELKEYIQLVDRSKFYELSPQFFDLIAGALSCHHFKLAEEVLEWLENESTQYIQTNFSLASLVVQERRYAYPALLPALFQNVQSHWNKTIRDKSLQICNNLMNADPALYLEQVEPLLNVKKKKVEKSKAREQKWAALKRVAAKIQAERDKTEKPPARAPEPIPDDTKDDEKSTNEAEL